MKKDHPSAAKVATISSEHHTSTIEKASTGIHTRIITRANLGFISARFDRSDAELASLTIDNGTLQKVAYDLDQLGFRLLFKFARHVSKTLTSDEMMDSIPSLNLTQDTKPVLTFDEMMDSVPSLILNRHTEPLELIVVWV